MTNAEAIAQATKEWESNAGNCRARAKTVAAWQVVRVPVLTQTGHRAAAAPSKPANTHAIEQAQKEWAANAGGCRERYATVGDWVRVRAPILSAKLAKA